MAALLIALAVAGGGYLAFWAVGSALERGHVPFVEGQKAKASPDQPAADAPVLNSEAKTD